MRSRELTRSLEAPDLITAASVYPDGIWPWPVAISQLRTTLLTLGLRALLLTHLPRATQTTPLAAP